MKPYIRVETPAGFDGYDKRRPVYCKSRNQASELKARIKAWKSERQSPNAQVIMLTESDKNWLGYLKNQVGDLSKLPEIIETWRRTETTISKTLVRDLRDQYLAFKAGEISNPRTLSDIRYRLTQFSDKFGLGFAHEVTTPQLREYLQGIAKGYSRRNSYKWIRPMFDFAKERRMISADPFSGIDRPEAGRNEPGIYKPEEFERLLVTADAKFPALVPFLAFAGLAGLRTSELVSMYTGEQTLQWSDVLWDKRLVHIRSEVAKQTSREAGNKRYVPMEDALTEWLLAHRKADGSVVPFTESWFRKQLRRLHIAAEVAPVNNALRHSYASYYLARTGAEGVGRLAINMGNSESVAKAAYIETLEPGEGNAWFGIRRDSPS